MKRKVAVIEHQAAGLKGKAEGDALEKFLGMMDDPDYWRTVPRAEGGDIKLTKEELEIIQRIQLNEYADTNYDPYEPYVDFFTGTVMQTPLNSAPEPKRRFIPSKWEALKVAKIVRGIRKGFIKLADEEEAKEQIYDIWSGELDASILAVKSRHISAPKMALPDHRESYNPPAEYLLTAEEAAAWEAQEADDRDRNYLPQKYGALRHVPGYGRFVNERFGRCLDLFLCPRAMKDKIKMHPDDLLPVLPDPRELRPFPTSKSIDFVGHVDRIGSISVDPSGQWLLSASMNEVRLWEMQTGHCRFTWNDWEDVHTVQWNPNKALAMFAVAAGTAVHLIVPCSLPTTDATLTAIEQLQSQPQPDTKAKLKWKSCDPFQNRGIIETIEHPGIVTDLHWHRRGDYFVAMAPTAPSGAQMVSVHQLSRRTGQHPFKKMPGILRSVRFHPTRPHLVLATQKSVRIYDLAKREQVRRLLCSVQSVSSLALHGEGDNIIIGSHDAKLCWFDLDYSVRPYRVLTNHAGAIRSVAFHPAYPLFASCGDDGAVQIIHGQVFSDLSANPRIVPVKTLRDFVGSVSQIVFHPIQPWIICATNTGSLSLFV
jgi:ribosome biogenesis protein ERB1